MKPWPICATGWPTATKMPPVPCTTQMPLSANQMRVTDNLAQLLEILPPALRARWSRTILPTGLIEIVMDLGRDAEARFADGRAVWLREGIASHRRRH